MEHIRGHCRVVVGIPEIQEHRSVYYLPHVEEGHWGIFDQDDRPVEIAVERGFDDLRPLRQIPVSNLRRKDLSHEVDASLEYIYGGRFVRHFGHFILETLARFWPYRHGFRPNQRVIMHGDGTPAVWFKLPYVRSIFGALGLSVDMVVHAAEPFRIDRLIIPEPALRPQALGYTAFIQLCRTLGDRLIGTACGEMSRGRPVYVSKTQLISGVANWRNEKEIEDAMAQHGIEIVHPQFLSFSDQIRLLATRETICGVVGSSHHVSVFAPPRAHFVLLSPERPNSNFFLVDALNGNQSNYFFAPGTRNVERTNPNFIVERVVENPAEVARALIEKF